VFADTIPTNKFFGLLCVAWYPLGNFLRALNVALGTGLVSSARQVFSSQSIQICLWWSASFGDASFVDGEEIFPCSLAWTKIILQSTAKRALVQMPDARCQMPALYLDAKKLQLAGSNLRIHDVVSTGTFYRYRYVCCRSQLRDIRVSCLHHSCKARRKSA
jgi:hypothetical protein